MPKSAKNPDWKNTGAYVSVMPGRIPRGFKVKRCCCTFYICMTFKNTRGTHSRVIFDLRAQGMS
jgi:hypothetical protein